MYFPPIAEPTATLTSTFFTSRSGLEKPFGTILKSSSSTWPDQLKETLPTVTSALSMGPRMEGIFDFATEPMIAGPMRRMMTISPRIEHPVMRRIFFQSFIFGFAGGAGAGATSAAEGLGAGSGWTPGLVESGVVIRAPFNLAYRTLSTGRRDFLTGAHRENKERISSPCLCASAALFPGASHPLFFSACLSSRFQIQYAGTPAAKTASHGRVPRGLSAIARIVMPSAATMKRIGTTG